LGSPLAFLKKKKNIAIYGLFNVITLFVSAGLLHFNLAMEVYSNYKEKLLLGISRACFLRNKTSMLITMAKKGGRLYYTVTKQYPLHYWLRVFRYILRATSGIPSSMRKDGILIAV